MDDNTKEDSYNAYKDSVLREILDYKSLRILNCIHWFGFCTLTYDCLTLDYLEDDKGKQISYNILNDKYFQESLSEMNISYIPCETSVTFTRHIKN